jgi:hypothetical protein
MKNQTLYFRLTTEDGGSLAASAGKPMDNDSLWISADSLVRSAIEYLHPDLKPVEGLTPEVWSQATMDRFDAMESMIQRLRNLMNDADVDQDGEWGEAIDDADKLMGWNI